MSSSIVPFILAEKEILDALPDQIAGLKIYKISLNKDLHKLVIDEAGSQQQVVKLSPFRFARILNLANGFAYGDGLGMPEWVMLDCGLLPAFFSGFMGPAHLLTTEQCDSINKELQKVESERLSARIQLESQLTIPQGKLELDEYIPLAEFCALARGPVKQVMAYSLCSLKRGLGILAKALGLALWRSLGYHAQMGVAQWTNIAAVRSHLRFGRLKIIDPLIPLHTKAGESFIYKLQIPELSDLEHIIKQRFDALKKSRIKTGLDLAQSSSSLYWQRVDDIDWCLKQRADLDSGLYVYDIRYRDKDSKTIEILVGHSD